MSDTPISDMVHLPSDQDPALQDMAFTFPVFKMGAEATRDNIARGDVQTKEGVDYWMLEGDGAQSSVRIDRLTPRGVSPVEVRLRIGHLVAAPRFPAGSYFRQWLSRSSLPPP